MTSVQNIRKPEDEGSKETFRTINTLKTSVVDFQAFAKLAHAHAQAYRQLAVTGKQLVECLFTFTGKINARCSDISETWMLIAANEKSIIDKYDLLADAMENELTNAVNDYQQTERNTIAEFERTYKQTHNKIIDDIRKAEKTTKGAGKKSPAELQQAIQDLTNKLNAMKEHRKNSLEKVLQMERRKYCDYLTHWANFVDTQISTYNDSLTTLKNNLPSWREKANSTLDLSSEARELVKSMAIRERTAHAINSSGSSADSYGYYDTQQYDDPSYSESSSNDYYSDQSYADSYSSASSGSAAVSGGGGGGGYYEDHSSYQVVRARALYDYTGSHGYELPFRAGDIITVTNQDEATGWWTGELNGQVGPFPGNYVELI